MLLSNIPARAKITVRLLLMSAALTCETIWVLVSGEPMLGFNELSTDATAARSRIFAAPSGVLPPPPASASARVSVPRLDE